MEIKTWKSDAVTIHIDYDQCLGHADCADACPGEVYELQAGKAVPVHIDQCLECCACVAICSESAITHSSCAYED